MRRTGLATLAENDVQFTDVIFGYGTSSTNLTSAHFSVFIHVYVMVPLRDIETHITAQMDTQDSLFDYTHVNDLYCKSLFSLQINVDFIFTFISLFRT